MDTLLLTTLADIRLDGDDSVSLGTLAMILIIVLLVVLIIHFWPRR